MTQILAALLVYLVTPAIGLFSYLRICQKMRQKKFISETFFLPLFWVFVAYGGALLVALVTLLELPWSGLASAGVFTLIFLWPIALGFNALRLRPTQKQSAYHRATYVLSITYFVLGLFTAVLFITNANPGIMGR